MEVVAYEPEMAPEITASYNDVIDGVPHCYPVTAEEFAEAVSATAGEHSDKPLHSKAAFVARDGRSVVGFADVGVGWPGGKGDVEQGVIQLLWYQRGHRDAGQALLANAEDCLRERGMNQWEAFPQEYRYRFYHLGSAYLSDHLDQVAALLGLAGYQRVRGEVYLDWPDFEPPELSPAEADAEIAVEHRPGRGSRPGFTLHARQGEKQLAVCVCTSCGDFSLRPEAQDWFMHCWLGVEEEMRGKGLGRHLLQRALHEARGLGYRHAAISTAWQNHLAFLFYSNFGYRVVDWTYGYGRKMDETKPARKA